MRVATIARLYIIPSLAINITLGAQRWDGLRQIELGDWNDLNIVSEGDSWLKVPSPFFKPGDKEPYPSLLDLSNPVVESKASILVLIAAFRETRTVHSLVSLFEQAEHPERVYVGVVQQNNEGDEDVFFQAGDKQPYPSLLDLSNPAVESKASILVLIAAFRETRTVHSLVSLFEQAEHPERVYVGVVQQNNEGDEDVLEGFCKALGTPLVLKRSYKGRSGLNKRQPGEDPWGQGRYTAKSFEDCKPASRVRVYRMDSNEAAGPVYARAKSFEDCKPASRVRVYRMDSNEAAGPVYARAQQRRLLQGGNNMEDFCLQLDAHAVFAHGWDSKLLGQFSETNNEYAVLTTYPTDAGTLLPSGEFPNTDGIWEMPHLCTARSLGNGVVRNDGASAAANLERPILGKLWAAGLSFSRCHAERDVPADPYLKQIFNGEEFSRGARLWTNGYDFYTLSRPVVGVFYGDEKGGRGSWNENYEELTKSNDRLSQLLCRGNDPAPDALKGFDLGHRRHYEDYVALTGVDPRNTAFKKTSCLVRAWTPWLPEAPAPYLPLPAPPGVEDQANEDVVGMFQSSHRVEG
eukprot:CAMPEP_0172785612 /NCGR_PEP_ID=MMETSP1074-20121228/205529_1 /TAXON_ID=2916 /ORGANISM="Ceratium fusus, Strain PA161109" /LENGTH=575 /DNA_ID=CAMNT_0013622623 /DNA_START=75 /DNA_END=1803 /DNA_ORIENTATION=+